MIGAATTEKEIKKNKVIIALRRVDHHRRQLMIEL
jgi:hypothetical protein